MANIITVSRFPLLFLIVILLTSPSAWARLATVPLVVLLIVMDTIDGLVARSRHEESLLGSVLDIMTDRSVELVMWVVYAHMGLVPLAIPIIFIVRGTVVDALRAVGVKQGTTPFGTTTSRIGSFLVGSPYMRSTYGIAKALAFTLLALTAALGSFVEIGRGSMQTVNTVHLVAMALSWIATAFCVVRGLPVIVESFAGLARSEGRLSSKAPVNPTRIPRTALPIRVGMVLARILPRRLGYWLAREGARVMRRRNAKAYRMLRENLSHVIAEASPEMLDGLAEDAIYELGCTYFDMIHIRGERLLRSGILTPDPAGWDLAQKQFSDPTGTIVVAGHVGNFDLGIQWVAGQDIEVQLLSLPGQDPAQNAVNTFRQKGALVVTPLSVQSLRAALRRLRDGGIVATGVDRPIDYDDPPIQFFDGPAPLPRGHVRLALQTGARIMVASCIRRPNHTYLLTFWPPLDMVRTGDREQDVELNTRRVLELVEETILQVPTQWAMLHPVWSRPNEPGPAR